MTNEQNELMAEHVACKGVVGYAGHKQSSYFVKLDNGRWRFAGDKSGKTYSHKSIVLADWEYESGGL